MEISEEVGLILKERRKMLRLTQQQLAKKAEITSGYISRLEHGGVELTRPTLQALLRALEISKNIANRFMAGIVVDGSELLEDGSLRDPSGLIYLVNGGMALPDGCAIVDQGPTIRPRYAVKLPNGSLVPLTDEKPKKYLDLKELPKGTRIDAFGHLRLSDERDTPLNDEEWKVIGTWRYLSPSKKKIASAMLKSLQICENLDRASQARGEEPIALEL